MLASLYAISPTTITSIIGKTYPIEPKNPSITPLRVFPTIPQIPKLLKKSKSETATKIQRYTSLTIFSFFFASSAFLFLSAAFCLLVSAAFLALVELLFLVFVVFFLAVAFLVFDFLPLLFDVVLATFHTSFLISTYSSYSLLIVILL